MPTLSGTGLRTNRLARNKAASGNPLNVLTAGWQANKVKALLRLWPAAPFSLGNFKFYRLTFV